MLSILIHVLLVSTAAVLAAAHSSLRLYHRVYHPIAQQLPFTLRGTIHLDSLLQATFHPSESISDSLTQFGDALQAEQLQLENTLYQIALERADDGTEAQWDISSVKVCHLEHSKSELLLLHATEEHGAPPHAVDYFVSPVPYDGSCPLLNMNSKKKKADAEPLSSTLRNLAAKIQPLNTTVSVRHSRLIPLPELRTPPPLSEAGEPITPPPEKSFIQKYWMYILAVLVALMVSGGPPEEGEKREQ